MKKLLEAIKKAQQLFEGAFSDELLKKLVSWKNNIGWPVWSRKKGSNTVYVNLTYGDTKDLAKVLGVKKDVVDGSDKPIFQAAKEYIKKHNLYWERA